MGKHYILTLAKCKGAGLCGGSVTGLYDTKGCTVCRDKLDTTTSISFFCNLLEQTPKCIDCSENKPIMGYH